MRLLLPIAIALLPVAAAAQSTTSPPPPPGTDVDRVTLHPGESKSFTLAPGNEHQLLHEAAPSTPGAVTVDYRLSAGGSIVTAVSHTGKPMMFTVLADPGGNGGFAPAGEVNLPGDGKPVSKIWSRELGTINVGDFVGGPVGDRPHPPAGG
ncbi:MAG: hypothetical protein ACTHM8_11305 [Sphingomonas sp.]